VTRLLCTGLLLGTFPSAALADWTVVPLHPAGAYSTFVGGVNAQQQVGSWTATAFTGPKPVIWSGSAGSMVNLAPGAIDFGELYGVSGSTQFGTFNGHASLWHGTAASRADLHPPGAPVDSASWAFGMFGSQQVGYYSAAAGSAHAAIWSGSAASFVDLHPGGTRDISLAYGTDGVHQGGYFQPEFGAPHAALWSGSAASMVDLNPSGADGSTIYGVVPGQQVGFAIFGSPSIDHGVMWSGTASSWVDLNPPGSSSVLRATCGSAQVGTLHGNNAAVWFGSAGSVINALLPPEYSYSIATSVYESGGMFYVGGWAERNGGPLQEGFLWVGVPAPSGLSFLCCATCLGGLRRRRGQGLHTQA
jgi:hypothetical protein